MIKTLTTSAFGRIASFTDIHFGRKNNSQEHNQDCLDFVKWFCTNVQEAGDITHIIFMGDWFETRSAINTETIEFSYTALKMLNSLNIPIIFIVGNHDLYRRDSRDIHSVNMFNEFDNIICVVDQPVRINDDVLFAPFLFEDEFVEYATEINNSKYVYGHFEFKGFIVTGYTVECKHGPDHKNFKSPTTIFSGHFHKRQRKDNICYIGNAFPMDYSDADDDQRGMMFHDHSTNKIEYINWTNCPRYRYCTLSEIAGGSFEFVEKLRVKCTKDVEIAYTDAQTLKESLCVQYGLRGFSYEESYKNIDNIVEDEILPEQDANNMSVNDIVVTSIDAMEDIVNIKKDKLKDLYMALLS